MNKPIRAIGFFLTLLIISTFQVTPALGVDKYFSNFSGKAIRGYDPVAYFKQNGAVEGKSEYRYEWQGATWYFASKQNLDDFIQSPESYAPQYGGYCSWAVSQGYTAGTDPEAWRIHEGKLYLNYSKGVQQKWAKDIPGNIQKADKNWPKLLSE